VLGKLLKDPRCPVPTKMAEGGDRRFSPK